MVVKLRGDVYVASGTSPNGVRYRVSTKTGNKQLAKEWEANFISGQYKTQVLGHAVAFTFAQAVEKLLKEKEGKRTREDYERQLGWWAGEFSKRYPKGILLSQITQQLIIEVIEGRTVGKAKATGNRYLAALRVCLNLAWKKYEMLAKVPAFFFFEEPKGRIRWLRPEQVASLLVALPVHLRGPCKLALSTGLRRSVVIQLRWDQVDLVRESIFIGGADMKNGDDHGIPLSKLALQTIRDEMGVHPDRVFTYRAKPFKSYDKHTWVAALATAGIEDFRWHDLRHTWAAMMAQSGVEESVMMILGAWKSVAMVKRYAHHATESLRPWANKVDAALGMTGSPEVPPPAPTTTPRFTLVGGSETEDWHKSGTEGEYGDLAGSVKTG